MSTPSSEKILVVGNVAGNFSTLYKRVAKVMKKFKDISLLLCSGSFFSSDSSEWSNYKSGKKKVPIQTLILGPNKESEVSFYSDVEKSGISEKICCLGKVGIYTTGSGMKIAFLSGMESENDCSDPCTFDRSDVIKLCKLCKCDDPDYLGIDILLTSQWPHGINGDNKIQFPSKLLPVLVKKIKPRYIFSSTEGVWFERRPYRNESNTKDFIISRFIGLANVGSSEKWIYAADIKKINLAKLNSYEVFSYEVSPFQHINFDILLEKRKQFFFSESQQKKPKTDPSASGKHGKSKPAGPCWFCLSSDKVQKHLIIKIGENAYLTLAKGGLVRNHLLIIPVSHYQSIQTAPTDVTDEVEKFKKSIRHYFKSKNCRTVFFERNYKTIHFQINAVPITERKCPLLSAKFKEHALKLGLKLTISPPESKFRLQTNECNYFHAELPNGENVYIEIYDNFPLSFGREVLAQESVLNVPDRIRWEDCSKEEEEERKIVSSIRDEYSKYDFCGE